MSSMILRVTVRFFLPLLLLFSLYLFLRGHNDPGGGFAAGLVAATAFGLYSLAYGASAAQQILRVDPVVLIGAGLMIVVISGLPGIQDGGAFLSATWAKLPLSGISRLEIGTPLIFDAGVFLVVTGVTLASILSFEEAD
jgi:multicomponent Na+:H+ antiporter subunit B